MNREWLTLRLSWLPAIGCVSVCRHFSVLSSLQPLILEYPSSEELECVLDLCSYILRQGLWGWGESPRLEMIAKDLQLVPEEEGDWGSIESSLARWACIIWYSDAGELKELNIFVKIMKWPVGGNLSPRKSMALASLTELMWERVPSKSNM